VHPEALSEAVNVETVDHWEDKQVEEGILEQVASLVAAVVAQMEVDAMVAHSAAIQVVAISPGTSIVFALVAESDRDLPY
jgi:hypothetical protein